MNMRTQVLEAVLKTYGKPDRDLYAAIPDLSKEELEQQLKELGLLDRDDRNLFYWQLQSVAEEKVYENITTDDSERIAEIIAEAWNEKHPVKIDSSLAISFLYMIQLKFPNSRKALAYVCEGDLQSYKAFNSKYHLFADLLVRYFVSATSRNNKKKIDLSLEKILGRLFDDVKRGDGMAAFDRAGFTKGKRILHIPRMNAYQRIVGIEKLSYAKGMAAILLDVLKEDEHFADLQEVRKQSVAILQPQDEDNNNGEDFELHDLMGDHSPVEDQKQSEKEVAAVVEEDVEKTKPVVEEAEVEVNGPEVETDPQTELRASLENALQAVEAALQKVDRLPEKSAPVQAEPAIDQRLVIAEEEIERLQAALEQEKQRVFEAEEKAYTKILQAIGGEANNYLLSDLFEESLGNIPENQNVSVGRLINLFSSLSLAIGLEEYSGGYDLGEQFTVHKDELIKNYNITGPIETEKDLVTVKLLKYGWKTNGKLIVQPLVEEIKGEN